MFQDVLDLCYDLKADLDQDLFPIERQLIDQVLKASITRDSIPESPDQKPKHRSSEIQSVCFTEQTDFLS